jgi:hypothetical protein
MKLRHRVETKLFVDSNDIGRLITDYFKFEKPPERVASWEKPSKDGKHYYQYEFVAQEEANNYANYDFIIDGVLDEFDKKDLDLMLEKKVYPMYGTRFILNYLAQEGVIDKGEYMIEVFW